MAAQRLLLLVAIDAHHIPEAAAPDGLDTGERILKQVGPRRANSQPPCRFQEEGRVGLAGKPKRLRVNAVGAGINQTVESRCLQNKSAVLA